ncbi:hypothetical protein B0H13DRAFT_2661450 [Mycena leptocephala]|nr:hypothetical protein B0H13DRAFT_2661450 [Mycena leptocephala]
MPSRIEADINRPTMALAAGSGKLSLNNCADSATPVPPKFDDLLNMLAASPQLDSLQLDNIIPDPIFEDRERYVHVTLPHLTHIDLGGHWIHCGTLLSIYPFHQPPRYRFTLHMFLSHVRAVGAPTPAILHLEGGARVGSGTSHFRIAVHSSTSPPTFREVALLSFNSHPINENALRQIMVKVFKAFPFPRTHRDILESAFRLLPMLEMVYLQSNVGASGVLRALPSTLVIVWQEPQDGIIDAMLSSLWEFLELRHAQGMPLEVLEIDERVGSLEMGEERWEMLFRLIGQRMVRNGAVYDPS